MLELSIPQLGEDTRNLKDMVFSVLTHKSPLKLIQIYNEIQRTYHVRAPYQGVRKAADLLIEQKVLVKSDMKYELRKDWVISMKRFFDTLSSSRMQSPLFNFKMDISKENYQVYELSSLFDLDVFWGDDLKYLAVHLTQG